jgi:phosphoribosylamine--glycine ligase
MIDANGQPKTLEFNCRLGDPETQPILMRLKSDLLSLLLAATDDQAGALKDFPIQWDTRTALGVVMASRGYPLAPQSGDAITGLPPESADTMVFHAGTAWDGQTLSTQGGRVLCVTALGSTVRAAQKQAYVGVQKIAFNGQQYRRDIGHLAIRN